MNRYLITALYVMAGCAVTFPSGVYRGGMPVGTDSYRLIVSTTDKGSLKIDKKILHEIIALLTDCQECFVFSDSEETTSPSGRPYYISYNIPEGDAHPIRAPEI